VVIFVVSNIAYLFIEKKKKSCLLNVQPLFLTPLPSPPSEPVTIVALKEKYNQIGGKSS